MKKRKKIIYTLVSTLLIVSTVFAPVAYASNPYNTIWKSSPSSVQKFNEYIASLPEENARLILDDEELVFMMKLDSYWEDPDESVASTNAVVSLPLSSYPAGNYYSFNGNSCTCHTDCDYVISTGGVSGRCYIASTKKPGNCIRYAPTGSIQCKAFADFVYNKCTGHDVKAAYKLDTSNYTSISNNSAGALKMQEFIEDLPDGSNIRLTGRNGVRHSIIINDATRRGVYIYDANRVDYSSGARCKIGYEFKTWAELASMYKSIYAAWTV